MSPINDICEIDFLKLRNSLCQNAEVLSGLIKECNHNGQVTMLFGNGGSATDAQHWAAELVCSYKNKKREPIAAMSLTSDSAILTAWSNDVSFDDIFARQVLAFSKVVGLCIGLSTSGTSTNVLKGLAAAKSVQAKTVLITGSDCGEKDWIDYHVKLPSKSTPVVQTLTQLVYHTVCEFLE